MNYWCIFIFFPLMLGCTFEDLDMQWDKRILFSLIATFFVGLLFIGLIEKVFVTYPIVEELFNKATGYKGV